jgi:putative nucleotidyltransferase with HDIG domain
MMLIIHSNSALPKAGGSYNRFIVDYWVESEVGRMHEALRKIFLEEIEIPGMPDVAIKVIATLEDEYCSIEKLEKIIMTDVSLTATILRIANSPLYSTGKPIVRVAEAMVMIGLQNVMPFVCIAVIANQYSGSIKDHSLIQHLFSVSQAASLLAGHVKAVPIQREVAAVAGLFHDVGKIILAASIPNEYDKIRNLAQKEKIPLFKIEDKLFGFNHCLIGAALATKWNLPVLYRESIMRHHEEKVRKSGLEEVDALCYLIRIADKMASDFGKKTLVSGGGSLPELLDALGIEESVYKQVLKKDQRGTIC